MTSYTATYLAECFICHDHIGLLGQGRCPRLHKMKDSGWLLALCKPRVVYCSQPSLAWTIPRRGEPTCFVPLLPIDIITATWPAVLYRYVSARGITGTAPATDGSLPPSWQRPKAIRDRSFLYFRGSENCIDRRTSHGQADTHSRHPSRSGPGFLGRKPGQATKQRRTA